MKFIRWVAEIFEGDDGRNSHKRWIAFIFTACVVYMVVSNQIPPTDRKNVLYSLLITISVLVGILTISQVLIFFGKLSENKVEPPKEAIKPGDSIKVEVTEVENK